MKTETFWQQNCREWDGKGNGSIYFSVASFGAEEENMSSGRQQRLCSYFHFSVPLKKSITRQTATTPD